jgi:probable rRNA maturation factor
MILNRQRGVRLNVGLLDRFLARVLRQTDVGSREVTICFVSNAEIARWNKKYRGKSGATDVLSFPAGPPQGSRGGAAGPGGGYLGDIAIAPATARKYAKQNRRTLQSELQVLILHGVLHLLGYDHESDTGEMDRLEQRLRNRLGLAK